MQEESIFLLSTLLRRDVPCNAVSVPPKYETEKTKPILMPRRTDLCLPERITARHRLAHILLWRYSYHRQYGTIDH
jgi:hypothetical protein